MDVQKVPARGKKGSLRKTQGKPKTKNKQELEEFREGAMRIKGSRKKDNQKGSQKWWTGYSRGLKK